MASSLLLLLCLLVAIGGSEAAWCVCRSDLANATSSLQKSLDYACGAGADCGPILQNGPCFNPNTVVSHCSYACNSYYQRKGQTQDACVFSGTTMVSTTDPSFTGCTFPATPSTAGTSTTTPSTTTPPTGGTTTPTTGGTPMGTTPPSTFTPGSTTTGGVLGGLGPSGTNFDGTGDSGFLLSPCSALVFLSVWVSLALVFV